jgi:hypothetical protein
LPLLTHWLEFAFAARLAGIAGSAFIFAIRLAIMMAGWRSTMALGYTDCVDPLRQPKGVNDAFLGRTLKRLALAAEGDGTLTERH